ncbi:hypothetical protein V1511DRAFT_493535 [Dipodascopsis uninucleata]
MYCCRPCARRAIGSTGGRNLARKNIDKLEASTGRIFSFLQAGNSCISVIPRNQVRWYSEIDPSRPEESEVRNSFKTGLYAPLVYHKEYIDPSKESISRRPIYEAPSSFHVAATKRVAWTIGILGGYFSSAMYSMDGIPVVMAFLVGLPTTLPLPIVQYLTSSYVSRIYRIYPHPEGHPTNVEELEKNEEFLFECISIFGRSTYNCRVRLSDLRVVNRRFGWVNLEVCDDRFNKEYPNQTLAEKALDGSRSRRNFYVTDDVGGYKMERIWAIIERQSGIDNGRD